MYLIFLIVYCRSFQNSVLQVFSSWKEMQLNSEIPGIRMVKCCRAEESLSPPPHPPLFFFLFFLTFGLFINIMLVIPQVQIRACEQIAFQV